jgi:hypothetical protein
MFKQMLTATGAAAALLLLSSSFTPTEAARGHGARGAAGAAPSGRSFSGSPRAFGAPRAFPAPRASGPRASAPRVYSGRTYSAPRVATSRTTRYYARSHRHRGFRGAPYLYAAPIAGTYYYATSYGCDWLLRRARETDSDYGWDRYEACVDED